MYDWLHSEWFIHFRLERIHIKYTLLLLKLSPVASLLEITRITIVTVHILSRLFRGVPLDIQVGGGGGGGAWNFGSGNFLFFYSSAGRFFFPPPSAAKLGFFRHGRSLILLRFYTYCLQLSSVGKVGFFTHFSWAKVFFYLWGG